MNNKVENAHSANSDDYRSFLLLDEISRNHELTQRDLSKKLGVALGLINSYIKNLASKGYITVSTIPRKRYTYYLTPNGLAEKTRLTYQHLQNFTNLYRTARRDYHTLFNNIKKSKIKKVVFCGFDEITEIAYLSLKEAGLELSGIVDKGQSRKKFFGFEVLSVDDINTLDFELIVLTSFQGGEALKSRLVQAGIDEKNICGLSTDWLKRIEG
ncbi:MAG: winged helix-turn-helix transcriptional regulator [Deltaproteobacteria bacterium]|nr:winged helix-turn-helix transcriptional regulator [Deltaproteobacteria bacterium]